MFHIGSSTIVIFFHGIISNKIEEVKFAVKRWIEASMINFDILTSINRLGAVYVCFIFINQWA